MVAMEYGTRTYAIIIWLSVRLFYGIEYRIENQSIVLCTVLVPSRYNSWWGEVTQQINTFLSCQLILTLSIIFYGMHFEAIVHADCRLIWRSKLKYGEIKLVRTFAHLGNNQIMSVYKNKQDIPTGSGETNINWVRS